MGGHKDKGEAAVSYAGLILVVAVIVAALAASGVGEMLTSSVESATCQAVRGGDCQDDEQSTTRPEPTKSVPHGGPIKCVRAPCPQLPRTPPSPLPKTPEDPIVINCVRAPCPQPSYPRRIPRNPEPSPRS